MGRRGCTTRARDILMERLERKVDDRFRHGAPAVHADLRAALEGLTRMAAAPIAAAGGAVRLRAQCRALADGGGAAQADARRPRSTSPRPACAKASSIRSRSR